MSWSSQRRTLYGLSIFIVLALLIGIPLARFLYHAPTCFDGVRNQGESAPDKGGPCSTLDGTSLKPTPIKFVRAFPVRTGEYAATAYIENPNNDAAVVEAAYKFSFYDANNILVSEREGTTVIMAGAITPVYVPQIISGDRTIAHSFFKFTTEPLVWKRAHNPTDVLTVANIRTENTDQSPQVSADVTNTDVEDRAGITYVATLFDTAGNAFASSQTIVPLLAAGATTHIVFTWPAPFWTSPSRVDVLPVMKPTVK